MKTITIDDAGNIAIEGELSNNDKINIGLVIYEQEGQDHNGQVVFYTGIFDDDLP
jgi:hypothetical protein